MWIVWLLFCAFGAAAPSAFIVSPTTVANSSTTVTNSLAAANSPATANSSTTVANITVPECAVIVKLANSTRHEFQIVPVECPPAPGLASPQVVYLESSDLMQVTRQKDVVVGDLFKFFVPSSSEAAAAAADVRRFTRGVRKNQPSGFSPFQLFLLGLQSLHNPGVRLWRETFYGKDPPSVEDEYNNYVVQLQKGPKLPRIRDQGLEHLALWAAKIVGQDKVPDEYDYQLMDNYTWEAVQVSMF